MRSSTPPSLRQRYCVPHLQDFSMRFELSSKVLRMRTHAQKPVWSDCAILGEALPPLSPTDKGLKHTKRVFKTADASKTPWQSAAGKTFAGSPGCFARRLGSGAACATCLGRV